MILVKADKDTEAGVMPSEQLLSEMTAYNEELVKAGVMTAGEGLHPSSKGARVNFRGTERIVTDGPFAETKELIAGFWLWNCKSLAEAIEWAKKCPNPTGEESQLEIRQVFSPEDFGAEFTPELREREAALYAELERRKSSETIGKTTFSTPTDRELEIKHVVDAPAQLVFDMWTKKQHLPHWMLGPDGWTMPTCEIDLRPGGKWRFGWKKKDGGGDMQMHGTYLEVTAPNKLVSTEQWEGGDWAETVNTLAVTESGGKSTLSVTMLYPSKEARDKAIGAGMKQGIAKSMDRLEQYVRTQK
jgi:uncharacterized protein YndB with AHSA1/START domain